LATGASSSLFAISNVIVKRLTDVDSFTIAFFQFAIIFSLSIPSIVLAKVKKNIPLFPPGFNFTNILRAAFLHKRFAQSTYILVFNFLAQEYWGKCAHKVLVKLTTLASISQTFYEHLFNTKFICAFCTQI
jgi:hypothetical protein